MILSLLQPIVLSATAPLWDFFYALANREPLAVFPVLFAVLIVLGLAACEIGARKDPVRRHQRHKQFSDSQTIVRL